MPSFGLIGSYAQQPGASYKVAQDGFATYDVAYEGLLTLGFPWAQGDANPDFPNTVLLSMSINFTGNQCDHVRIELHYEGKDTYITNPITSQNIALDVTTSQVPIEAHPLFTSTLGGTPASPLNGAIFDATTGQFIAFDSTSQFAGIQSFIAPQEMYTFSDVELDYPSPVDMANIGHIITPTIPLPVIPTGRNWLSTGIRVQNIANVYYRTQYTGMLSGPRAWNTTIYG